MKKILFVFILLMAVSQFINAQDYQTFYEHSLAINNTGIYILGSWAMGNIVTGAIGWKINTNQTKYFHQMNLFWNVINLSIAGIALYNNYSLDINDLTNEDIIKKAVQTENILLINAGLDVLYMGSGFLLKHISLNNTKRADLLRGYGNSLILQGSFLFIFDLAMSGIQRNYRLDFLDNLHLGMNNISFELFF